MRCFLSGVRLDDGNPLHHARMRRFEGREVLVCLAVAHAIDVADSPASVRRFAEIMLRREDAERRLGDDGRPWIPDEAA